MKKNKYDVTFHFGKRTVSDLDLYLTALALTLLVKLVVRFSKLEPKTVWLVIDDYCQRFQVASVNKLFIEVPELLHMRVEEDVNKAIQEYKDVVDWEPVMVEEPTWTDQEEGETPLGGELGFSYDFVIDLEDKDDES